MKEDRKSPSLDRYKTSLKFASLLVVLFFIGLQASLPLLTQLNSLLLFSLAITLYLFLLALGMMVYQSIMGYRTLGKRLEHISNFSAILSRDNLGQRMAVENHDELGRMESELNLLAEKIEKQVNSLQRLAEYNEAMQSQVHTAAIIEERQRLARDLHDAVSQQLFALSMMSAATLRLFETDLPLAKIHLQEIADMASRAQGEMRALLLHLRPVQLSEDPLHTGVENLVRDLGDKCKLKFDLSLEPVELSRGIENHLFRIIQEALSNILRHAEATRVRLAVFKKDRDLFLHISDNGRGFRPEENKSASYGLKTMQERCEEIGGSFTLTSKEKQGTHISIRIPLKGKEPQNDRTN
jgi:two-component system, NarL family, sensor histidine kinase LiaS